MFTLNKINEIHNRPSKQATLPEYLPALNANAIDKYKSIITNGHPEYYGKDNHKEASPPVNEIFTISDTSNQEAFLDHLSLHEQGKPFTLKCRKL